jgi:hypothetical protein
LAVRATEPGSPVALTAPSGTNRLQQIYYQAFALTGVKNLSTPVSSYDLSPQVLPASGTMYFDGHTHPEAKGPSETDRKTALESNVPLMIIAPTGQPDKIAIYLLSREGEAHAILNLSHPSPTSHNAWDQLMQTAVDLSPSSVGLTSLNALGVNHPAVMSSLAYHMDNASAGKGIVTTALDVGSIFQFTTDHSGKVGVKFYPDSKEKLENLLKSLNTADTKVNILFVSNDNRLSSDNLKQLVSKAYGIDLGKYGVVLAGKESLPVIIDWLSRGESGANLVTNNPAPWESLNIPNLNIISLKNRIVSLFKALLCGLEGGEDGFFSPSSNEEKLKTLALSASFA